MLRCLPAILTWIVLPIVIVLCVDGTKSRGDEAEPSAENVEFFEKKIRPVLVTHCQKCHGAEKQEQSLRVDSRAALLQGGDTGPAIVPGKPDESLLVGAINHGEIYQMPPKTKLPAAVIADLTNWVKMGAPWANATAAPEVVGAAKERPFTAEDRAFWSFQTPQAITPPAVRDGDWCQSPIDRFVLARLEAQGLSPAPRADKRTLIRRATFDLHGLPPSPEEVTAFLADESPEAFGRVVDRLLGSPRYGQRWARHWLDVARYADSNGMDENVAYANAYHYRDYVVNAFNSDKPYDQFVREQIAGDLLADPNNPIATVERLTATGFLVIGPKMLAEDDPRKMEMDIVDEQLDTVGRTFMGLTLGCARCHDHKFDPIPAADYYSLAAIFKSTKTMENFKVVAMWNERPAARPVEIAARDKALAIVAQRKQTLETQLQQSNDSFLATAKEKADKYFAAATAFLAQQKQLLQPRMNDKMAAATPGVIVIEAEKFDRGNVKRDFTDYGKEIGVIYNAGELPNFAEYDFEIAAEAGYQIELRLAAAETRPTVLSLDGKLIKATAASAVTGTWQPDSQAWSAECVLRLAAGKHTLRLERAGAFPHFDQIALVPCEIGADEPVVIEAKTVEQIAVDHMLNKAILQQWIKYLEKSVPLQPAQIAAAIDDPRGPFRLPKNAEQYFPMDTTTALNELRTALTAAEKEVPSVPMVMSASEGQIANLKIHLRGNYLTLDREVPRQFPRILAGDQQTPIDSSRSGRLELAQWMTSPTHPLTSRVMVNRVWHWHFGNGIVRTPDNFGLLGEAPDDQPLLDWLAVSFVAGDWSLKRLHREIMLSSTYQMSTTYNEHAAQVDPENRLHWRADRRRLEAEALRDSVLFVSGQLDETRGGTLLNVENHKYVTSTASEKYSPDHVGRRSIYLPITRSSVYELFQAFDFADPSTANGQRVATTIAPQALALMNSRLIEERTKQWATSLVNSEQFEAANCIRAIYAAAYSRPPTDREIARGSEFLQRIASEAKQLGMSERDARLRARQSLCRVVIASSEFIYVE